jgi:hypothetical protein
MDEQYNQVTQTQKRICSLAMTCSLIVAVFFLLIHENAIAKGLLLGSLFSIINFVLMGVSIPMTLHHSRYKSSLIGLISILIRYALLAIPLVVGIRSVSFSFIAVFVGIFSVQIVTLFEYTVIRPILNGK